MNPMAAYNLIDEVESAIYERLNHSPEAFEQYRSKKQRLYPYYRIYIKNYTVYYVVIHTKDGPIMEVRRLLNNRQNREKIL